jgi:hypothetical protein
MALALLEIELSLLTAIPFSELAAALLWLARLAVMHDCLATILSLERDATCRRDLFAGRGGRGLLPHLSVRALLKTAKRMKCPRYGCAPCVI